MLLGDAAHTINPLAGQGVNLGFKDVEAFLTATAKRHPLSSKAFVQALETSFESPRRRENLIMMTAMDGFYTLFSNDIGPIKWVRNQLLSVAQKMHGPKREVLKYAIGLR